MGREKIFIQASHCIFLLQKRLPIISGHYSPNSVWKIQICLKTQICFATPLLNSEEYYESINQRMFLMGGQFQVSRGLNIPRCFLGK